MCWVILMANKTPRNRFARQFMNVHATPKVIEAVSFNLL